MTGTEILANPLRYHGEASHYVDVAVRGTAHLGVSLQYAVHPKENIGCFILRFVAHGEGVSPDNFKHLTYREKAGFVTFGAHAEAIKGVRLNKLVIKAYSPGIHRHELDTFATKFNTWFFLAKWITENLAEEGFTVNVDLAKELRGLLIPEPTPEESVGDMLILPTLTPPKQKLKLVDKPVDDEDDLDDEDDDKDDDKGWLN